VIVTVPLGVLKAGVISFRPKLPPRKIQAINNIGVGVVEKVILSFDDPFWRLSKTQPRRVFYISDAQGEFPAFIDASDSAGRPVLVAFLTGEHVHLLETDAEAMVDRASQILKSIFGDKYRAQTSVHVTNWGTDPFSLGIYSTPTVGVTAEHYEQLAQPVGKRVLFAGEATYREHAGFVERAMGSGIREARRLLGREVDLQLNPS
jgi:polyamine oxidase